MLNKLTYYETGSTDPAFNLALEQALGESELGQALFMLWQNEPAVIIGRHQNAWSEVNLSVLEERGIKLVRRLTGGGAVYHDLGNLNFTFILPCPQGKEPSQKCILRPLLDYFGALGLKVIMEGRNDISLKGCGKISGLASRRLPGKFLLHGTILYDVNLDVLSEVLLVDPAKYRSKGVQSVRARVCNLREHADISLAELEQGIKLSYPIEPLPLPAQVRDRAGELKSRRYANAAWNLGMSPPGDICLSTRFSFGSVQLNLATTGAVISQARITGDFLTSNAADRPIEVEELAQALIGLPAHDPKTWAAAWSRFDFSRVFFNCADGAEIIAWLSRID